MKKLSRYPFSPILTGLVVFVCGSDAGRFGWFALDEERRQ